MQSERLREDMRILDGDVDVAGTVKETSRTLKRKKGAKDVSGGGRMGRRSDEDP